MKTRRLFTNCFIVFHLVLIAAWSSPFRPAPVNGFCDLFRPYVLWTGLFQSWDTFAPNPTPENTELKAIVMTEDNHLRTWIFPRMRDMSVGQRYRKERYRKFEEAVMLPSSSTAWIDVARHLTASLGNRDDIQDKVILLEFTSPIVPWHDADPGPSKHSRIFFSDFVSIGGRD